MSGRILYGVTVGISADTFLRGQLRWFRERGWEVHLVTSPGPLLDRAAAREQVVKHELEMAREISAVDDLRSLGRFLCLVRSTRPDVVSVGTPKAALLGTITGWLTRVPRRVYVVRGLRLEGTSGLQRRVLWAVEKLTMACATDVVAVSHSLATELTTVGLVPRRGIWVVGDGSSNGVDAAAVQAQATPQAREEIRARFEIPSSAPVIGFVGRKVFDKGIDRLVAAAELPQLNQVPGLVVLAVGSDDDDEATCQLTRAGVRVVSVPHVEDPWRYYAAFDVLCLPTRREGFPNVVLEAGAAGIPTVATRATGSVDSVVDGVTGYLVDGDDHAALADRLARVLTDREHAEALGTAARQRVERDFRPERIWSGLEAVYRGEAAQHDDIRLVRGAGARRVPGKRDALNTPNDPHERQD